MRRKREKRRERYMKNINTEKDGAKERETRYVHIYKERKSEGKIYEEH